MTWIDDIEAAPCGGYVLGFVPALARHPIEESVLPSPASGGRYFVGKVIFPKSKRLRRRSGIYNFKANDGRGSEYIITHWMLLPEPPQILDNE